MLPFWQPLRPFGPPYFIVQLPLAIVYPNRYAILTQGCARRRVQSATAEGGS